MKIENPFESGHIRNYILAYVAALVIVILFFIASSLFNDVKTHPKKEFNTTKPASLHAKKTEDKNEPKKTPIKLLDKAY